MHLLFISSMLPENEPRSGFEIATRAIADAYLRQGVRLSFAGFRRSDSRDPVPGEIALGTLVPENAAAGPGTKARWLARALALDLPVSAAKLATMGVEALHARLEAAGPVDGFVLNSVQMPTAYPFLPRAKPSVFVAHNVEHRSADENADNARTAFRRRLYRREARLLQRSEAAICREAAIVHALSDADAASLPLPARRAAAVLPLATGRSPAAMADDGRRICDIGLIGTWSWAPNRAGLDWFVETVVPRLPPDVSIAVAGAFEGPPPPAPPNVRFLGRVPDAQTFLRETRVVALASTGGTGVQLKTIEAFEEGIPAVATPAALRGVAHLPANVTVAEGAPALAQALAHAVAETRAGRLPRCDGSRFATAQRDALAEAVRDTIADLEAVIDADRPRTRRIDRRPSGNEAVYPMAAAVPRP